MPLIVKPGPARVTLETAMLPVPELLRTALSTPVLPRLTLPKAKLVMFVVRMDPADALTVRVTGMKYREPLTPEVVTNMWPLYVPAVKAVGFTPNWIVAWVVPEFALMVIHG